MTPLRESMERSRPAAEERWEAALAPDTVLAPSSATSPSQPPSSNPRTVRSSRSSSPP